MAVTRTGEDATASIVLFHPLVSRLRPRVLERLPSLAVALADQATISGANFLLLMVVARRSGVEAFGAFTLAYATLLFVLSIGYALINQPMSVLLPERSLADVRPYLAALERLHRLAAPALLVLALPLCLAWDSRLVMATAAATAARLGCEYHRRVAYALGDAWRALAIDVVSQAGLALAALAAYGMHAPLGSWQPMAAVAATSALGWMVGLRLDRGARRAPPEPWSRSAGAHWALGSWNLGGTLAMHAASQLYPFLVAGFLGLREVALFNGGLRIMGVTNMVMQGIEAFAVPELRRKSVAADFPSSYRRKLRTIFASGVAVFAPLCLAPMLAPERIMTFLLGPGFGGGGRVLRMIAATQLLIFLARMAGVGLNSLKEPRPGFWGQAACAVVTVAAGPLVVRWSGLDGACEAMLANAVITFLIVGVSFARTLRRYETAALSQAAT